jgi:hypothetical protein
MFRPSLRRIAVLALCLALAGSGLLLAKPRASASSDSRVSKAHAPGIWDTVWIFLLSAWTENGSAGNPYGVDTKNGPASDPYGQPSSGQSSQPTTDNGCSPDPSGQCLR